MSKLTDHWLVCRSIHVLALLFSRDQVSLCKNVLLACPFTATVYVLCVRNNKQKQFKCLLTSQFSSSINFFVILNAELTR